MTALTDGAADLLALRELADDIFMASTEPVLDALQVGLAYDPALWDTLTQSGLTLLSTPESRGGSGAGLRELAVVLERSGYHAAPVPLAEHDLLASWLLALAHLPLPSGTMTSGVTDQPLEGVQVVGTLNDVPWSNVAENIVIAGDGFVAMLPRDQLRFETQTDIAGQSCATVHVDTLLQPGRYRPVDLALAEEFNLRGALGRALQTCGALTRALDLACDHARNREQFGRPIAKFQAVQALTAG